LRYDDELIKTLRSPEPLRSFEYSDHNSETVRALGSALLIAIASKGELRGFISLGQRLSDQPYTPEDKSLLLMVANQMATFIEDMKTISRMVEEERIERELQMAAEVQRHLLPADSLQDEVLDIFGTCRPARGVGGDYYDYFAIDDHHTGVAIADVAGKGLPAALLMSTVQASLRCQLFTKENSPAEIVSSINRLLQRSSSDANYATFFFSVFDKATHGLTYVNAGHNPPILLRAENREIQVLTTGGSIIGSFINKPYEQETITLKSGDLLVVYTDGVTEALNPAGLEFGEDQLRSIVIRSSGLTARQLTERIIARVLEWQASAPQHDDITLIVVRVK
jgi:sigma-B regulation protein RsbU (phosphoserine phosphatase)